jgi:hypothetical protein
MTEVEALVLAEVTRVVAHVTIREGRDGGEGRVVAVILAAGSAVGRDFGESHWRKSCIVSLTDVGSGKTMTTSITVSMTGGETS